MPDSEPSAPELQPSTATCQFTVQFWGVRGGIPTPGSETVRYGGNTSCIEMRVADRLLIFDAGTGLRVLGKHLLRQLPVEAHLFFTHCHWDRIQGFPFFVPGFIPGNRFHLYGASATNGASLKQRLNEQMLPPNFPVPIQIMQSDLKFHDISPGDRLSLPDIAIETSCLNDCHHTTGYRVTCQGYSAVYATDTLCLPDRINPGLLHLAREANLLIYDATSMAHRANELQLCPDEVQDWTWKTGIAIAKEAGVKQLVICHHDPSHSDDFLDRVETQLQSAFPHGKLAREGMSLNVCQA
ncbi:MBL fold metallo-hydrolase [Oscillatoria laete-virens NRMC-F 0139]|nr:MBL fold metallo-hydrolase [Oscillatoria laete-virens]MDL5052127.1 MBL fold metallo-hydrolase [Oscillatoria laete-virens NRMC-F 0139]